MQKNEQCTVNGLFFVTDNQGLLPSACSCFATSNTLLHLLSTGLIVVPRHLSPLTPLFLLPSTLSLPLSVIPSRATRHQPHPYPVLLRPMSCVRFSHLEICLMIGNSAADRVRVRRKAVKTLTLPSPRLCRAGQRGGWLIFVKFSSLRFGKKKSLSLSLRLFRYFPFSPSTRL